MREFSLLMNDYDDFEIIGRPEGSEIWALYVKVGPDQDRAEQVLDDLRTAEEARTNA